MRSHLSNITPESIFMVSLTALNAIAICLTLAAVLETRILRAQSERQSKEILQKQARRQARQSARRARKWRADVSTQTIRVPSSPNGRIHLSVAPVRHAAIQASDSTVGGTPHEMVVASSTDYYVDSNSSSDPSVMSSSHPFVVDLAAFSAAALSTHLMQSTNLSGIILVGSASSESEDGHPRSRLVRQQPNGRM
jgi:hypothetical protein